ncbi:hypothetical protein [Chitinophaga sp.]|nr:hypothetical protein [uncultured Chitinophaga sp.]
MKSKWMIGLWASFLFAGCASQKQGCPGSTFYNSGNMKQNSKAGKQMKLF